MRRSAKLVQDLYAAHGAKAKQAIADYKKAVGDPAGVAELMVYFRMSISPR
jgi:hypothetical protein